MRLLIVLLRNCIALSTWLLLPMAPRMLLLLCSLVLLTQQLLQAMLWCSCS